MNLIPHKPNRTGGPQAFTLIECMVYMAVLVLLFDVAVITYGRFLGHSRDFRRNAADIVRVIDAGERWRREVRTATAMEALPVGQAGVRLQTPAGEVRYVLDGGTVWREGGGASARQAFLPGVRRSEFVNDVRSRVTGWRWEVELQSPKSAVKVRPLFSFTAVMDKDFKP